MIIIETDEIMETPNFQNPETQKLTSMKPAYDLLGAANSLELLHKYSAVDQELMKNGLWDYKNPELTTNKIKVILESINDSGLNEEDRGWKQEILWFWYHHAISSALNHKEHEQALAFANKALELQSPEHPNRITRLLKLLLEDNIEEAETWAAATTEEPEKTTANDLLNDYKKHNEFNF